jgi:hypothetical protein
MDLGFNALKNKAKIAWPKKGPKTPELRKDILRENVETDSNDYRLSFRFSSILDHVKKNWADLKSLKNKL